MFDVGAGTFTESSVKPKELTADVFDDFRKTLESMPAPEGLVLLPNGSGFDMYRFPVALIKGAMSLMLLDKKVDASKIIP